MLALALAGAAAAAPPGPPIVQKSIPFPAYRKLETEAYAKRHYGLDTWRLVRPHVIVEHYTATESFASVFADVSSS